MQYRTFGKLDWKPSALGFGAMRLPILDNDSGKIDEVLATQMIRTAIDAGVNYVDTAWPYHKGESESFVGRCLQDGYRDKVKLATKMPCWLIEDESDFDKYLDLQLERLQTDHIDFYLLHALNKTRWPHVRDLGVREWAEKAIASGRIGHLGFSFHDELPAFKEIVDAHDWTFCQIMYNYMDTKYQAGERGLRLAIKNNIDVISMEPLRGGQLSKEPPAEIKKLWDKFPVKRSYTDGALQWVWHHQEIPLILSGMTKMEHVKENIESANQAKVGLFSDKELDLFKKIRKAYFKRSPIRCTSCKYCEPCPHGVAISSCLGFYMMSEIYDDQSRAKVFYNNFIKAENQADRCIECGECEKKCPQKIPIMESLKKTHELLGK